MRGRRQGLSWVMLAILLLACMTIQGGVRITKASSGKPAMRVDPRIIEIPPPETFDININVTDIVITSSCKGLHAWDFSLEFDPSILEVTNVTMGLFLYEETGWETAWQQGFVTPAIDNVNGFVSAGDAIMPDDYTGELPGVGASGNGLLATIAFNIKDQGTSLLHLDETYLDTVLGEPPLQTFVPIDHEAFDGLFEYPLKVHDIAVTHVTASPTSVPVEHYVYINATVKNEGQVAETFKVKAYHNWTQPEWSEIGKPGITVTDLAPGNSETVSFSWKPYGEYKGTFIIKAEVDPTPIPGETDTADNTKEFDITVFVGEAPEASFTYSPSEPLANEMVTFNSTSSDPDGWIVNWAWDLDGDGVTDATTENATHTYIETGTYTVNLTVTDNDGLTDTATDVITVLLHDIAVTSVTASPIAVMPGTPVKIDVTIANLGTEPETFDVNTYAEETLIETKRDITLEAGESRILNFSWKTAGLSEGDYTIKANATILPEEHNTTNNEHIYGTVSIKPYNYFPFERIVGGVTFKININTTSIVSYFTYSSAAKEITFNATAVPGLEGQLAWWNVTIPKALLDGSFTVLIDGDSVDLTQTLNTTHTSLYFNYTLSSRHIRIKGTIAATPPVASFTPLKTEAFVNEPITFDASASYDPDGNITSYFWDFGDETNTTDVTATHSYSAAGNYTVTLTVTDNHTIPLKDSYYKNVTILWTHDVAVANLTVYPNTVKKGEPVYINVTVANEGDSTERFAVKVYCDSRLLKIWYPSQVMVASHENTTLTYTWDTTEAGKYTIKANATLDDDANSGNNELIYGTVTVLLSSTISISASPTTVTLGESTAITGSIDPKRTGVTVTIQYRPAGGSWSELTTVTTDEDSQYAYVWTPTTLGTYELKASWEGDANTSNATSNVIAIEVVEIRDITLDVGGVSFHVVTESNSTISNFELIQADKKISFNVTGPAGTVGYCNVTIPKDLLDATPDQWTVLVDGESTTPLVTDNATHTFIYFTCTLSTRKVEIKGATVATPPIALFTPSTTSSYVNELITFDASASYDDDGDIGSWDWDFDGDGVIDATGEIVEHAYSSAGNYTVTLTVTDDDGLTDIATDTVTIKGQEAPALDILLYVAAAGAAAIIIVAIAFYFLRAKKQGMKHMLKAEKS